MSDESKSIAGMKHHELKIKPIDFTGTFTLVPLLRDEEEMGYAIVVTDAEHKPPTFASGILLFITIKPKMRKKGYATKIVQELQRRFDKVTTHYLESSKDGRRLMERNGFKKEGDKLVWRKALPKSVYNGLEQAKRGEIIDFDEKRLAKE